MPDTKIRALKATSLLKEDHRKVKALFRDYEKLQEKGTPDQKLELFEKIKRELTVHATIEEEIFYPAIDGLPKDDAHEMIAEAAEEHKIVKTLLEELTESSPEDLEFDAKMKVLMEGVRHHAEEEETEIFPFFDELAKGQQEHISWDLERRKFELKDDLDEE